MKITVLMEKLGEKRYRASGLGVFALSVEGESEQAALTAFRCAAGAILPVHGNYRELDLSTPSGGISPNDPWAWFAGLVDPNDPLEKEYQEQIQINRRLDDEREARKMVKEEAVNGKL